MVDALEPTLLPMGFPERKIDSDRTPCVCCKMVPTRDGVKACFSREGFFCPRCLAKHCELPTECRVCGLHLVTAPHIARSYHHLFPVKPFSETEVPTQGLLCAGCETYMTANAHHGDPNKVKDGTAYQCNDCGSRFCFDCDATIHEVVHNCPVCASTYLTGHSQTAMDMQTNAQVV